MNQEQPFPNPRDEYSPPEHLEQRLQQWQPRPVELRASEILRAAAEKMPGEMMEQSSERGVVDLAATGKPILRHHYWQAITLSWSCGVLVGGLLAFLVLASNRDGSGSAASSDRPLAPSQSDEIVDREGSLLTEGKLDRQEPDEFVARPETVDNSPRTPSKFEPAHVSPSERWIAHIIGGASRFSPTTLGTSPLRAGSHFQWNPSPEEGSQTRSPLMSDQRGWEPGYPIQVSPVSARLHRDELLEELLGTDPAAL